MLPKNLVLDEAATPKTLESLQDLLESTFKTEYVQTTLESLELTPDGTVWTPIGELRLTQDFLEHSMKAIRMPSNCTSRSNTSSFARTLLSKNTRAFRLLFAGSKT